MQIGGWNLDLERLLTRKRVLIGIAAVYWLIAAVVSILAGVFEENRILRVMRGLERFDPADQHLSHMARAAREQGSEAELVTLLVCAAVFLVLVAAWWVWETVRADAAERTAQRRAARRAPFEAPPAPEPVLEPALEPGLPVAPVEPAE
jgi:hypothetical protein